MVATLLTVLTGASRLVLAAGIVLCFIVPSLAEEYFGGLAQEESGLRSGLPSERRNIPVSQDKEAQVAPLGEDEELPLSFSDKTIREEDLPPETLPDSGEEEWPSLSEDEFSPSAPSYSFPSDSEQPLPFREQFDDLDRQSVPEETPPFMSRPLEWERTPPTVMDTPSLPSSSAFSDHELVAFTFIEEGKAHFDRGEWELAQERFERAIGLAPFLPYGYYFLGRIAFVGKELKSALAFLQKAELLFPRTERAWLGETTSVKGTIYEDLEDYAQARETYKRSLRFQPTNLKVLSALARLPEEEPPFREPIP